MSRFGGPRVEAALRDPTYLTVANIIGIRNLNSNNDVDAIEDYLAENGDPYQNQLDAANQALIDQQNQTVQLLEEITLGSQRSSLADKFGALAYKFEGAPVYTAVNGELIPKEEPLDPVEALTLQLQQNQADVNANLQAQLAQSQQQFEAQMAFQQQQAKLAQKASEEQARIAKNQANAFTPAPNPTAQTVSAGDDREELFATPTSKKKKTEADDLSIISGVGTQGNPLAGLQIA